MYHDGGQWERQDSDVDRVLRVVQGKIGEAGMEVVRAWGY